MSSSHTPGPWRIDDGRQISRVVLTQDDTIVIRTGAKGCAVAFLSRTNWPIGQDEANAALIAGAPETAAERDRLQQQLGEIRAELEIEQHDVDFLNGRIRELESEQKIEIEARQVANQKGVAAEAERDRLRAEVDSWKASYVTTEKYATDLAALRAEVERLTELLRSGGANRYWEGRWRDNEAEKAGLVAALNETTAEVVQIRTDIAAARHRNMQGVAHPRFDETAQREFARLERTIERARTALAKATATEGGFEPRNADEAAERMDNGRNTGGGKMR